MNKDIGYFIYHNCKRKDCVFFPTYNKMIGKYDDCYDICKGCESYKKAKIDDK